MSDVDERLREVIDVHFDPRWGTEWWLDRVPLLGFDPRREIRSVADLQRLPAVPEADLARLPVQRFLPRRYLDRLPEVVSSETGGTTGAPSRTLFLPDEFEAAFVTPFVLAARRMVFPRDRHWLFIGPSGPHVIGKAARACARAMGSLDPFAVDFDPRWVRKLPPTSLARRRYTEHVLGQAMAILESQEVGVLFTTPPVLAALGQRLEEKQRQAIAGIHLGGMSADAGFWRNLTEEWFPAAAVLAGYGNSLAGVCPQLEPTGQGGPEYFPHGHRLLLEVVTSGEGGRGRVRFHRLDHSALLPGMLERDEASIAGPPPAAGEAGFLHAGLRDPRPRAETTVGSGGLY